MRRLVAACVVIGLLAGGAAFAFRRRRHVQLGCATAIPGAVYSLDTEQASNAATIAAVGLKLGMPNHAVTIALATALLESRLRNLTSGDRDSAGLFQQRPSQGWGTRDQILNPRYAATSFYRALLKVPGWRAIDVTVAAQSVQRSAMPTGYASWEGHARALARALTGEVAGGLICTLAKPAGAGSSTASVADNLRQDFGDGSLARTMSATRGWAVASWLVAKADVFGIRSVRFSGRQWTRDRGTWLSVGAADMHVTFERG